MFEYLEAEETISFFVAFCSDEYCEKAKKRFSVEKTSKQSNMISTWFELPDGTTHGLFTVVNVFRGKMTEAFYVDGKKNGKAFYRDPYEDSFIECEYLDDEFHGRYVDQSTTIKTECYYVNGTRTGMSITWNNDGQKLYEGEYVRGKKVGVHKKWNTDGTLNQVFEHSWNGKTETVVCKNYYASGQLKMTDTTKGGKRQGKKLGYHPNGNLKYESNWKYGQKHGLKQKFYPDGTKELEVNYMAGRKHGTESIWGKQEKAKEWVNGVCVVTL